MQRTTNMGTLYFGDNLHILRENIRDETVDLIYLDPPFNSKRDYNLLFKTPKGQSTEAQIGLFVTLTAPTQPMITEAASAGYYDSQLYGAFPKIQILTIEGLLSGKESPRFPDLSRGGLSFKKAKVEKEKGVQGKLEL